MPKVLIREYDKSTTGIPVSDNFAVVVPGYFGTPAEIEKGSGLYYDPKDLLVDSNVYELKSQSDFEKYIGKHASTTADAEPPRLEVLHSADIEDIDNDTTTSYNSYTKYFKAITPADIFEYPDEIYIQEIVTSSSAPEYGKDGYLYKTFTYKTKTEQQKYVEDKPQYIQEDGTIGDTVTDEPALEWIPSATTSSITVKFKKLTKVELEQIEWGGSATDPISSTVNYCIIKKGNEGSDAVHVPHIGNQIAYELLGLGYTVLFKKLSSITFTEDGEEVEVPENTNILNEASFWEPLKDKSIFNFRYVMTGGYYSAAAMSQICSLAAFRNNTSLEEAETYGNLSGRGDCIALCDINENIPGHEVTANFTMQKLIQNIGFAAKAIQSNEYSAIFAPRVTYVMSDAAVEDFGNNKIFPASFHYLACAARTFERYNEWYAVAGYNRGISNYSIANTSVKLGEIAINTLAPRIANNYTTKSINLILHERGNYYLWGNRTGYALDNKGIVFHHFLNIRQLCCSIKKQLYTACRQFTFDPNSDLLWINFVNAIKPTLEAMKADQGIKGYTISRVANDKKALLTARIRIVPIEAVEDFDISIYLEDSLTGIVVSADETQA